MTITRELQNLSVVHVVAKPEPRMQVTFKQDLM